MIKNNWKIPFRNIVIYTSESLGLTLGNGKTLVMGIDAFLLKQHGYKIYSNYKLNFADKYYAIKDLPNIVKTENKIILLADEISKISNAYFYAENKKDFKSLLTGSVELRKKEIHLFATAQTYHLIPRFMRRLSQDVMIITKIHSDKTVCNIERNENCEYDKHYYHRYNLHNSAFNEILTPDLIIKKGDKITITPNFFYDCYDSDEVIE